MDSSRRMLLALVLITVATAIFMMLSPKPQEEAAPDGGVAVAIAQDGGALATVDGGVAVAAPTTGVPAQAQAQAPGLANPVHKTLTHEAPELHLGLDSQGAALVSAELLGAKMREQRQLSVAQGYKLLFGGQVPDAPQMDMAMPVASEPKALSLTLSGASPIAADLPYEVVQGDPSGPWVLRAQSGPWRIEKKLLWPQGGAQTPAGRGFELGLVVTLTNTSDHPLSGELGLHWSRAVDPEKEQKASLFGGVGNESKPSCLVSEKLRTQLPGHDPVKAEDLKGPVRFFGIDQQYFLGAIFPVDGAQSGRCELVATPTGRAAVGLFPIDVGAGQTVSRTFGVYVGPKEVDALKAQPSAELRGALGKKDAPAFSANLGESVNFGIWEFICVVLLKILNVGHAVFGNWGLAIVFLVVVIKLALLPLSVKAMTSAEHMKKLQPKMEEVRKKYAADRERMNLEVMKLYQEAKVNPLGGCLPMLVQMPVWFALFTTLRNSYEIYREPFIRPVWMDLTFKDPTYLFPILLGVTMIVTQSLQPAMVDRAQQRMMTFVMPIFFTFLMLSYPAGLTLYIFTNNLLTIAQQYGIKKYLERRSAPLRAA